MPRRLWSLLLLAVLLAPPALVAQQPTIGVFSRIYMGGTAPSNPQIRWGSSAPTGSCTPGSFYLQNTGPVYFCFATTDWRVIADTTHLGNDFYASAPTFGAKCNGVADDTVAIQGAIDAAYLFGASGHVVLPPGICNSGPLMFGPVTNPFQEPPDGAGSLNDMEVQFNAPRAVTFTYGSITGGGDVTLTFSGTDLTAIDVGNEVFYGPIDPDYFAFDGRSIVTVPTYACTIVSVNTGAHTAACTKLTTHSATLTNPGTLTPTTGSHASWVTDDHHFTILNGAILTGASVGKQFTFAVPVLRAPLDCTSLVACVARPNGAVSPIDGSVWNTPPCDFPTDPNPANESWQCVNGGNVKLKYFSATITSRIDNSNGTYTVAGLSPGSNWVGNFTTYAGLEWAFQLPVGTALLASNPHLDHLIAYELAVVYLQTGSNRGNPNSPVGKILAYTQPTDTSQRFLSFEGAGQSSTTVNFTGCPATGQWTNACAAILFSRNKYFTWSNMGLNNASGSSSDDLTQWGAYLGGLPGGGTQALQFDVHQINISGFGVGLQIGDNLGGEASDGDFHLLSTTFCGIGVRIGPGSFNTLDLHFYDYGGGLDKIGMLNYEGNVFIDKGSFSFNIIDFVAAGFGTFTLQKMRTEGPGMFLYGADPNSVISNNTMAEPQGSRAITGNVTATPDNVHTVASVAVSNVSTGVPAGTFYPITFGAGDITVADVRKTIVIPGLGAAGADVVAQINQILSSTTGLVNVAVANAIVSSGTVTLTVYDTNTCDLTFPTDAITQGDIGAALALPNASVVGTWNRGVRAIVTSVASPTTGKCGYYLGSAGAGPVKPAGGTTTNPYLFAYIAAYISDAELSFDGNRWPSGRMWADVGLASGIGSLTVTNNQAYSLFQNPISFSGTGRYYRLNLNTQAPDLSILPTPSSNFSNDVGLPLPWTLVDTTNQGFVGTISVLSHGNKSNLFAGPVPWTLPDGWLNDTINVEERFQSTQTGFLNFDTPTNPFLPQVPDAPVSPVQQLTRLKLLSEAGYVNGKNLRISCTFATSDTVVCPFQRSEAWESRRGVGSPTFFDPVTRTFGLNVTTGHFTQTDVGKTMVFPAASSAGDILGYIVEITSATVIKIRSVAGTGNSFDNGITTGTATVGLDEPDALWLPVGLTCNANETFYVSAHDASGVTLKSSNATSTASCTLLVVR